MIQRAEWRPRADDPRSPIGVYFGRDRWLGLPVGLWIVAMATAIGVFETLVSKDGGRMLFIVAVMSLVTGRKDYRPQDAAGPRRGLRQTLALMKNDPFALVASRLDGVADLVPLPAPDDFYGVEMTLRRGKQVMGGDLGVVAFSGGWLVYEGIGTAFSLSRRDVRGWWNEGAVWTLALPDDQFLSLESDSMGRRAAMRAWIDSPAVAGVSRLPPLTRNPIRGLRPAGTLHLVAAIVGGFALSSLIASAGVRGLLTFGSLALVLYLCGVITAMRSRRSVFRAKRGSAR